MTRPKVLEWWIFPVNFAMTGESADSDEAAMEVEVEP
jgi:hypothetical protein